MTYDEQGALATAEKLLDTHNLTGTLTTTDIEQLDQFHAGGSAAVDRLIAKLSIAADDSVLDIGSGFGGPARRIAETTGATVHGVDITSEYVDVANSLTERCALDSLVSFEAVDIAAYAPRVAHTVAVSMHVQMNIEHKVDWYKSIATKLAPGARFGVWDICTTAAGDISWPMPWSIDGTDSYLVTPDEARQCIEAAGFTCLEWEDATTWVQEWFAATFANGLPSGPGLPMLLDDGFTRVFNIAGAQESGTLAVVSGVFRSPTA